MSSLFSRILHSVDIDSSVVGQISLQTFASFAELTAHESVVANSIGSDERTHQTVVNFLTRVTAVRLYSCPLVDLSHYFSGLTVGVKLLWTGPS